MISISPRRTVFLRDAVVSTALLAVPMALYRIYVELSVLRIPGMILYLPFMVVYIVLGGETEAGRGPSTLQIGLYLVVLGLLVATVAHYVRRS
ncbi:hypothetical protein [Halosimplex sp. TS25]|uniref:hypothetical protein n=1 Tax=Halosimplex rarum TaxID=3396619 RepID=UPI0039ECFAC7